MLQEAVDALLTTAGAAASYRRQQAAAQVARRHAQGQAGRFRQNLLGKRVDYSGRSVIVAGPSSLHQWPAEEDGARAVRCSSLAADAKGLSTTVKQAKKLVEKEKPEVWDIPDGRIREIRCCSIAPDAAPPGHPGVRAGADRGQGDPAASARLRGLQRRLRRRSDGRARRCRSRQLEAC